MDRAKKRHANFMKLAEDAADMATCDRAHVGCVLVRGKRVIASGYNGAPPDAPHCDEVGHDMEDGHCVRPEHAEVNAIIQCAEFGVSSLGAVCYCTMHPCIRCARTLYSAGVKTVYYKDGYASMSRADAERIRDLMTYGLKIRSITEVT